MISIKVAEEIHKILITRFGGSTGIRDISGLESALARPFQTFDNRELYPTTIHKAAALIESILTNHPFIDGNKRTGYVLLRIYLLSNGMDIKATEGGKYDFVIKIASGKSTFEDIIDWLNQHTE